MLQHQAFFFNFFRKARKLLHTVRCEQSPRSYAAPQIHMRVGPCNSNAETRGPREPLPGHGLRHLPHLAAGLRQCWLYTVHNTARGLLFLHPQSRGPLRVTPRGLSEAVPQASTTQHFGLFIPRRATLSAPCHWPPASGEPRASSTGALPLPWIPTAGRTPGSPVNSGSSPEAGGNFCRFISLVSSKTILLLAS